VAGASLNRSKKEGSPNAGVGSWQHQPARRQFHGARARKREGTLHGSHGGCLRRRAARHALPTGEVGEEGDLDEYAGISDLLSPEDDSDDDDEEILPRVTRCREPPDNPTIPKNIEPPQAPAQQENRPDADVNDYAFGIIFSRLHDVRRHFINLVVKGLINLTEARE
jgi:hypothetical protein